MPRLSGDGRVAFFYSSAPFFDDVPRLEVDLFSVDVATGEVRRQNGLEPLAAGYIDPVAVDGTGRYAAAIARGNPTGTNADWNNELWLVDQSAVPCLTVSGRAPTRLTATPDAGAKRFDFVRGDVASLQFAGGEVDLGPLVCLEDDSPDRDTAGYEDPADPPPGRAFFYLYRGSPGNLAPGSFGTDSAGRERRGGAGECER